MHLAGLFVGTNAVALIVVSGLWAVVTAEPAVRTVLAIASLAYFANFSAGLTHYGTTPAPIYFGAGYVSQKDWWRVGFYLSPGLYGADIVHETLRGSPRMRLMFDHLAAELGTYAAQAS